MILEWTHIHDNPYASKIPFPPRRRLARIRAGHGPLLVPSSCMVLQLPICSVSLYGKFMLALAGKSKRIAPERKSPFYALRDNEY